MASISEGESKLLEALEEKKIEVYSGETLIQQGNESDEFYILKKGWAIKSVTTLNEIGSVVDIHHPGDIIGASQIPFQSPPYTCKMVTNGILCPFPRKHLDDLLRRSPRLSGLLMSLLIIEKSQLHDRLSIIATQEAHIRLGHLLLHIFTRLQFMNHRLVDQFYCPLNQVVIGNIIGTSSVHVSRMFTKLMEMNLIDRHKNFIKFLDRDGLITLTGFTDRYDNIDLSWLPKT